jgi:hypothetical protein
VNYTTTSEHVQTKIGTIIESKLESLFGAKVVAQGMDAGGEKEWKSTLK